MNNKKDCFGITESGRCKVLTVEQCEGYDKCAFFKTINQFDKDKKKYPEVIK